MGTPVDLKVGDFTYLGLFDDKLLSYGIPEQISADGWNWGDAELREAALFQGTLLLNDGYIATSPFLLREFLDRTSLLRLLMGRRRVVIFSRDEAGMVDRMTDAMLKSAWFVEHHRDAPEWNDQAREAVRSVCLDSEFYWAKWPERRIFDNATGFDHMVLRGSLAGSLLERVPTSVLNQLFERYQRIRGEKPESGARGVWESIVAEFENPSHRIDLMWFAIEAYHYNMAMSIKATNAASAVSVQTIGRCPSFHERVARAEAVELDFGALRPWLLKMPPDRFADLLSYTDQYRLKFRESVCAHLDQATSDKGGEMTEALADYIEAMRRWLDDHNLGPGADHGTAMRIVGLAGATAAAATLVFDLSGLLGLLGTLGALAAWGRNMGELPVAKRHLVAWYCERVAARHNTTIVGPLKHPGAGTFVVDADAANSHLKGLS